MRRYLSSDYFRRKDTKPMGKSQLESCTFSLLSFYMEENQTRFVESSDVKKLVANSVPAREDLHPLLVPESTKSQQNMLSTSLKMKKVTSRLSDLILRKINCYFIK